MASNFRKAWRLAVRGSVFTMNLEIPFLGRDKDLEALSERVKAPGLTVVAGLPQQGKSRLFLELINRKLNQPSASLKCLFGYFESSMGSTDVLRRALEDLYARWLADASYREQAERVFHQWKKDGLVDRMGSLTGKVAKLALSWNPAPKPIGDVVSGFFQHLVAANQELKGTGFETLSYELAQDLIRSLNEIVDTETPVVLILDAFERSGHIDRDAEYLHRFLNHIHDWSPCHILVAVRKPPAVGEEGELRAYEKMLSIKTAYSSTRIHIHDLEGMDLADSQTEAIAYEHMRSCVQTPEEWFDHLDQSEVMRQLDGYPAVLERLADEKPGSLEDFQRIVSEARTHQYTYVRDALRSIADSPDTRPHYRVAARLALVPELSAAGWEAMRPMILNDAPPDALADLQRDRLLYSPSPPSFGHATKRDAARRFVLEDELLCPFAPDLLESLILECAARVQSYDETVRPFLEVLVSLGLLAKSLDLHDGHLGLCAAAAFLLDTTVTAEWRDRLTPAARLARTDARLAPLVRVGLVNAIGHSTGGNVKEFLDELRTLSSRHPDESGSRRLLAMGLANAFRNSTGEDAKDILDELRTLSNRHPDDAAVREELARVLFISFNNSTGGDAKGFLDALRILSNRYPNDAAVREKLASGLFNAFNNSTGTEAEGFLDELQTLSNRNPDDAAVRETLAMGLVNAIGYSTAEELTGFVRRLRVHSRRHPSDAAVRKQLAIGLFNAFSKSKGGRAEAFLDKLRALYSRHSDHAAVREWLAKALFNAFHESTGEETKVRLGQLRTLSNRHPNDTALREPLARALVNSFNNSTGVDAKGFLDELRTLSNRHPHDDAVREDLGRCLCNAIDRSTGGEMKASLDELELLSNHHPGDSAVRAQLAKGYCVHMMRTIVDDNTAARQAFDQLRALHEAHRDDEAVAYVYKIAVDWRSRQ